MKEGSCDGCSTLTEVKPLRTNKETSETIYLCKNCWKNEMLWREQRNKELDPRARFPIRAYPYTISRGVKW